MKNKLIHFAFTVFMCATCFAGNITVSGKITNMDGENLKIAGLFFKNEIKVNSDGTFSETFNIDYDGIYVLSTLNERMEIYLVQNNTVSITADDNDFFKTVKFGDAENQYLAGKAELSKTLNLKETYMLEEADFIKKVTEFHQQLNENFKNYTFINSDFKALEAKNLHYWEQNYFARYSNYHPGLTKVSKFKLSENFPKMDPTIEPENEADFFFSIPYREILRFQYYEKLSRSGIRTTTEIPHEIINEYKSSYIQSMLLEIYNYNVKADNPKADELYSELMKISTNEPYKTELNAMYESMKNTATGKPSPVFNYINFDGGNTSLESLRGKYVYIDVWATWCAPCRAEIPHLKVVEEKYQGKNIEFVSISIDKKADFEKWKKMIVDKQLGGIQLIADNEWQSDFVTKYAIQGIPRFILVDPNGNIVEANAPAPSDKKLIRLLRDLKI